MTNNTEIEYKNLLTVTEFQNILKQFPFDMPFEQTNTYFDTPSQQLEKAGMGLRIRQFETYGEQTLKIPSQTKAHQLTEITDRLTLQQAKALSQAKVVLAPSSVTTKLQTLHISHRALRIIGVATTKRYLCQLPEGLLTLDQTTYYDHVQDFELELEIQSAETPEKSALFFQNLCLQNNIPQRPSTHKVARTVAHFPL